MSLNDSPMPATVVVAVEVFPVLSETFVIDQIEALVARSIDVRIVARCRGQSAKVDEKHRALESCASYMEDWLRLPTWLPLPIRLRLCPTWLTRRALQSADLALCHFGPVGLRAAKALQHDPRPAIWTIFHGNDMSAYVKKFGPRAYRPLFDRGELFFGVSRLWMAKLKELGCPEDRVRLMRMGVDVDAIAFRPRQPESGRPLRFLSVGRLVEKKGIATALRAVAELRGLRPELAWSYDIVGDGPLRSGLERLCDELQLRDRVTFLGKQSPDEIFSKLEQADMFILPSVTAANGDMEGIPVSLMEAMAAGVPVLSTFHSGIPELIEQGVSGLLAPERDHVALADNILRLVDDPGLSSELVSAARDKVEREFSQSRLWDDLAAAIRARLSA